MSNEVYQAQEVLYKFPYHHTPHFDHRGAGSRVRALSWGFEYLCTLKNVKRVVEAWEPQSVLEVGCGDGVMIGSLDGRIPRRVGVDLSERAILFAKGFFPEVEFSAVDAATLEEQFDVVMAVEVLEHIPDQMVPGFLNTLIERTKSGGHIFISVPTVNTPLNKKHYRHYTEQLLREHVKDFSSCVDVDSVSYLYVPTWLEEGYRKITDNPILTGEINILRRPLWRYVWRKALSARAENGIHLVACLRKR